MHVPGPAAAATRTGVTTRVACVDLDGTLISGDLLWESFVALATKRPLAAALSLLALLQGVAAFKQRIAELEPIAPDTLPYRPGVLAHLRTLEREQVHLVLVTASDRRYASAVAEHLGLFAEVLASDGTSNLSGRRKAAALVERYGASGFHYFGNDWNDVPVWRAASGATAVGAAPALIRYLTRHQLVDHVIDRGRSTPAAILRALRPHQWVKNLLVFVPILAAHDFVRLDLLALAALSFVAFSLCSSAIYLMNDMIDIQADRHHPRKRQRPFAAGEVSIPAGVVTVGALLAAAFAIALIGVSWPLAAVLAIYVVCATIYSLVLKPMPVVDVFALTSLYLTRIVAGGIATQIVLSSWLLGFALFLFLSLAFVKRYTELLIVNGWMPGRGYGPADAQWMHAVGTSSGYMAVLVLALYVNASEVATMYARPQVLWGLCPLLLFWLTRIWFRAGRGSLHDDPVAEALGDRFTYVAAAVAIAIVVAAI